MSIKSQGEIRALLHPPINVTLVSRFFFLSVQPASYALMVLPILAPCLQQRLRAKVCALMPVFQ
eukprot:1147661-Pelagomonas_calceolata.AAC.2